MKRLILSILSIMLVVAMLSGCGPKDEATETVPEEVEETNAEKSEKTIEITVDVQNSEYIFVEQTEDKVVLKTPDGADVTLVHPVDFSEPVEATVTVKYTDSKGEEREENKILFVRSETEIEAKKKAIKEAEEAAAQETPQEGDEVQDETIQIDANAYAGMSADTFEKTAKELGLAPSHDSSKDSYSNNVAKGNVVWHGSGSYEKDEKIRYGVSLGKKQTASSSNTSQNSQESNTSSNNQSSTETSNKKGHYEERTVLVKEAYDEQVVVKEGWTEQVLVKDAWTEEVNECSAYGQDSREVYVCNGCGYTSSSSGDLENHISQNHDQGCGSYHNDIEYTGEYYCVAYNTSYVNHPAEYKNVYHEPEYTTVHHEAEYRTEKVWVED